MNVCVKSSTVAAALAFLAIPAMAGAHAGNPDPNMVHVCIGNLSKVVRSVGVDGICISTPPVLAETADHWPKQATAGPKGDKGDTGDQGIQGVPGINGTAGTNGIDGTSVRFVDYFSGNQNGCPNGGATYAAGNPPMNSYVCNGADGRDGQDATTGATRPDPPCFDNVNRYVDCGNGTVTDMVTGLIWLKDAACLGFADYASANAAAAALENGQCGLTDGGSAGDWRLPTKDEWAATIARAAALGCTGGIRPSLTNARGTGCFGQGGPMQFTGVEFAIVGGSHVLAYWSSTADETFPVDGWFAHFVGGFVESIDKTYIFSVWPVRGGSR